MFTCKYLAKDDRLGKIVNAEKLIARLDEAGIEELVDQIHEFAPFKVGKNYWRYILETNNYYIQLLIDSNSRVKGFSVGSYDENGTFQIDKLGVDENDGVSGRGSFLMKTLIAELKKNNNYEYIKKSS